MRKKEIPEEIDKKKVNELVCLSKNILKIAYIILIVVGIYAVTILLKEWKLLDFFKTIIKIIAPLFIGLVLAWLLDPLVTKISKKGINRLLSTAIVFVGLIAIIVLFGWLIAPTLGDQINEIVATAPSIIENIINFFENIIDNLSRIYDYDLSDIKLNIVEAFNNIFLSITVDLPKTLVNIVKSVVNGGINIIFGLFIAFYMLLDFNNVRRHLLTFIPKKVHSEFITVTDKLNRMLKNYVQGTFLIMFLLFICQSIGFSIAGLKAPLVFGLFCAITNIIPYFGPYIGGIPAVIVGFTMDPLTGIFCLISVVTCQFLESYFLNPVVMSKTMKLHPVTIMIGLLIFGHFFGILGMILSTPVIACSKLIFNHFNDKYQILGSINDNIEDEEKEE